MKILLTSKFYNVKYRGDHDYGLKVERICLKSMNSSQCHDDGELSVNIPNNLKKLDISTLTAFLIGWYWNILIPILPQNKK